MPTTCASRGLWEGLRIAASWVLPRARRCRSDDARSSNDWPPRASAACRWQLHVAGGWCRWQLDGAGSWGVSTTSGACSGMVVRHDWAENWAFRASSRSARSQPTAAGCRGGRALPSLAAGRAVRPPLVCRIRPWELPDFGRDRRDDGGGHCSARRQRTSSCQRLQRCGVWDPMSSCASGVVRSIAVGSRLLLCRKCCLRPPPSHTHSLALDPLGHAVALGTTGV